jgi:hypothetical protein
LRFEELFGEKSGETDQQNLEMAHDMVPGMEKIPAGVAEK